MNFYPNTDILYKRGLKIGTSLENAQLSIHDPSFFLEYDYRTKSVNMGLPHYHLFYEMMIFLSPNGNHYIDGRKYQMRQGDIILLRPGVLHQSEYLDDSKNDRILIQFVWPGSLSFPKERKAVLSIFNAPVPVFRFEGEVKKKIDSDINALTTDFERTKDSAMQKLLINARLEQLLCDMYFYNDQNIYFQVLNTGVKGKVYDIVNYIHVHYTERLSLRILAEKFFINPYYLSHCFKDMVGFTVGEYIQVTRIRNAQYLLDFSNMKIADIAEASGFLSFSQFNRSFWKFNNMAPSTYRKMQRTRNTEAVRLGE